MQILLYIIVKNHLLKLVFHYYPSADFDLRLWIMQSYFYRAWRLFVIVGFYFMVQSSNHCLKYLFLCSMEEGYGYRVELNLVKTEVGFCQLGDVFWQRRDSHWEIISCIWRTFGWRLDFGVHCVCVFLKVGRCITGESVEDTKAALCPGHVMPVRKAQTMWSCLTECWVELTNAASPLRCEHDRVNDWEEKDTAPLKDEDIEEQVWTRREMKVIVCQMLRCRLRALLWFGPYSLFPWRCCGESGCLLSSQFVGMWRFCKNKKRWLKWTRNVLECVVGNWDTSWNGKETLWNSMAAPGTIGWKQMNYCLNFLDAI